LGKKKAEVAQPEVVTTYVSKVRRVYIVPTNQGVTLDMFVNLACGGSTMISGLTSFSDKRPVQILKSDITYCLPDEEEEAECSTEK
jgi:hypothetical protein